MCSFKFQMHPKPIFGHGLRPGNRWEAYDAPQTTASEAVPRPRGGHPVSPLSTPSVSRIGFWAPSNKTS